MWSNVHPTERLFLIASASGDQQGFQAMDADVQLIWKLGPASASGRKTMSTSAPVAIKRMLSASRPKPMPARRSKAATQLRTVGTWAPVSKV